MVRFKKYDEALELAGRSKSVYQEWKLVSENKTLLKQILRTYNSELEIYRDVGWHKEKAGRINDIEGFVQNHRHKMPKEYLMSFWFQLAYIHFMQQNYNSAVVWVTELINAKFKGVREGPNDSRKNA